VMQAITRCSDAHRLPPKNRIFELLQRNHH
jgi:hypothetical protein